MQLAANHIDLLKAHLQAIVAVEYFTIPLYLTAVYSFTDKALAYSPDGKTFPLNRLQQEVLSVAVQEMYHLQCASNLVNAFDVTPSIPTVPLPAGVDLTIPHLEQDGKPLTTQLGNLPAVIEALIAIEKPDPHPFPPPNDKVIYASIADLYHATLTLLGGYLEAFAGTAVSNDPHFIPNHNQVAYATFATTYLYNVIKQRSDAAMLANAIADQGEGHTVASKAGRLFRSGDDGAVLPEFWPAKGTRFFQFGQITHYKRFEDVQSVLASQNWESVIGGPVFYKPDGVQSPDLPSWAASYQGIQDAMNTIWSYPYRLAARRGEHPEIPQPEMNCLALTRHNYRILTYEIPPPQFALLKLFDGRCTVAGALESLSPRATVEEVGEWLRDSYSKALFAFA